ncbi:MAG: hypothetical protein KatS3mg080_0118 [Anoxybacillus sp.]|nr:MAG: hypothetical protein KatS3mg080_0118 [Anoxybacillus sp.]
MRANCLDFEGLRTIRQMVFQSPGGFEAVQKGYFYQRARVNKTYVSPVVSFAGNVFTRQRIRFGFSDQMAIARHNGLINGIRDVLRHIVFMHRRVLIVHAYIRRRGSNE